MSLTISTVRKEMDVDMDEKYSPPPAFNPDVIAFEAPKPPPTFPSSKPIDPTKKSIRPTLKKEELQDSLIWVCTTCTFAENREPALACSVCGAMRETTEANKGVVKPVKTSPPKRKSIIDDEKMDEPGLEEEEDVYVAALREAIRMVIDNNRQQGMVDSCVTFLQTMEAIMGNIQKNPDSKAARRLKVNSVNFVSKLGCVQGSHNFLQLCGYRHDMFTFGEHETWEIENDQVRISVILSILKWSREYLNKSLESDRLAVKLADEIQKEEEKKRKLDRDAANNDAAFAQRLDREERERVKKRAEDEKASLDLVAKLNQMFLDEQFAEDLKKNFEAQQNRNDKKLEEDMRLALKMQDEEETQFQKLLAEEKARREQRLGPGYWTDPLPDKLQYRRVELLPDHYLFDTVYGRFKQCGYQLLQIEYVQNPSVWERYCTAKKQSGIPEVWRFHGTPHQNVEGICHKGLLVTKDVSGRGTTIWSAENPLTSVGYSNKGPAKDGTLYMFLCRVLSRQAGVSTVQDSGHIFPEFLITYRPPNNGMPFPGRIPPRKVHKGRR